MQCIQKVAVLYFANSAFMAIAFKAFLSLNFYIDSPKMTQVQPIILETKAAKYISLQRLEAQALGSSIHYSRLGKLAYKVYCSIPFAKHLYRQYSIHIEPFFRSRTILSKYTQIMTREFDTIQDHLGSSVSKITSIGPGIGGLEIVMSRHLSSKHRPRPYFILVDKSGIDPIHFGFEQQAAAYNSLELLRQTLIANGHSEDGMEVVDAADAPHLLKNHRGSVDLIVSLLAWGFHFPVHTYLDLAKGLLKPTGRIILDVRKGTPGVNDLNESFESIEVIHDDPKFERLLICKLK